MREPCVFCGCASLVFVRSFSCFRRERLVLERGLRLFVSLELALARLQILRASAMCGKLGCQIVNLDFDTGVHTVEVVPNQKKMGTSTFRLRCCQPREYQSIPPGSVARRNYPKTWHISEKSSTGAPRRRLPPPAGRNVSAVASASHERTLWRPVDW